MWNRRKTMVAVTLSGLLFGVISTWQAAPLSWGSGTPRAADAVAGGRSAVVTAPPTLDDLFARVARTVPGFGGMYLAKGGTLQVYLVDPSQKAAAERAIIAVFGKRYLRRGVQVIKGRYGFLRLKQWQDQHRLHTLALPGVVLTGIDEAKNRLEIGLAPGVTADRVTKELKRLRVPLAAVEIKHTPWITEAGGGPTLRDTRRPLEGGLQIDNNCTLGALAVRQGVAGFVTASHCTAQQGGVEGTIIYQAGFGPGTRIGVETVDPQYSSGGDCPSGRVCRISDSAFIRRSGGPDQATPRATAKFGYIAAPNFNSIAVGNDTFHITSVSLTPALDGQSLSKVGRTTGLSEGFVSDTCDDMNVKNKPITLFCQYRVDATGDHGDSGSPVFDWNSATLPPGASPPAELYGILWGVADDASHFDFSPIGAVSAELGIGYNGFVPGQSQNSAPEVKIRAPINGASVGVGAGNFVEFQADAVDYEDSYASGGLKLSWSSDKDGSLNYHGPNLEYAFSTPGTRTVTVTATDSGGLVATDSITVTASASPVIVKIVKPTVGQTMYKGYPYVLEADSSDPNLGFNASLPCSALKWTSSNPADSSFPRSGCQPVIGFTTTGIRTITLTGSDIFGFKASQSVQVAVANAPANSPPIVTIFNPSDNAVLPSGNAVTLWGTATDPDNQNPLSYSWVVKYGSQQVTVASGTVNNGQPIILQWTPANSIPLSCGGAPIQLYLYAKDVAGMTGSNSINAFVSKPVC